MPSDFQNIRAKPKAVRPAKIEPLSVLPVFFNLREADVLVVGGSEAVAWKLELLLAAGARVRLVAENLHAETKAVLDDRGDDICYHQRNWLDVDFANMRLALADFDEPSEATAFTTAAKRAGVPVNIIDTPELCDFQFGSIINRSPVVVAVSTSGAAPVLAQDIRARIEIMLPKALGDWAAKAKSMRKRLKDAVPNLAARKAIWRDFAAKAMSEPASKAESFFRKSLQPHTAKPAGKVTLVGAGPGDAELLTIKAMRALQSADIILFDNLVSPDVLELARREARRMLVGKRGGQASCRQDDINAMMLKLARQGKHVVRLKSGDPMIFGRAGEEIEMLEGNGIKVEIVPGITSAMAAASRLGVSLTHRDHAQAVKFITAHSREGKLPEMDWRACADEKTSLMIYMGARTAPKLAEMLLFHGMPADLPIVIAKGISRASEEISYHFLGDLGSLEIDRTQPVLIGIGHVFNHRMIQSLTKGSHDDDFAIARVKNAG